MGLAVIFLLVIISAVGIRHFLVNRRLLAYENELRGIRKAWELDRAELDEVRKRWELDRDELNQVRMALADCEGIKQGNPKDE